MYHRITGIKSIVAGRRIIIKEPRIFTVSQFFDFKGAGLTVIKSNFQVPGVWYKIQRNINPENQHQHNYRNGQPFKP